MLQSNLVLVSTAALILGAGVVVGRLSYQLTPPRPPQSHNWLADQLKLTPEQRTQMDSIWGEMQKQVEGAFGNRHTLQKNHQQAILNLFTPQQRAEYDKLDAEFRTQVDELYKDREKLMQNANEASRKLLDADQQKKWDQLTEMNSRRGSPGNGPGWGGPGGRMRGPGGRGGMDEHGGDRRDRNGGNSGAGATNSGGAQNDSSTTRPSGGAQLN